MKAPIPEAAGKDASPSGAVCDTHAPIIVQTVTRGRCRRVRPIVSCRFLAATMSAPCGAARGSITDSQSQIALFTFLGTVDSSADPGARLAGFDLARDAFSVWHRPSLVTVAGASADLSPETPGGQRFPALPGIPAEEWLRGK